MTNWKQITQTPTKTYERIIDSDKLVGLLAQCHFLRQAGEDLELHHEIDARYETTAYILTRKHPDYTVTTRFEKI